MVYVLWLLCCEIVLAALSSSVCSTLSLCSSEAFFVLSARGARTATMHGIADTVLAHGGISFEWGGSAFDNQDLNPVMSSFQDSGYRVLVTMVQSLSPVSEQLAQFMLDNRMTDGYALLTPACQQNLGPRGSDANGLPLLGVLSSQSAIRSSEALTAHYADVAANCTDGGTVRKDR